MTFEEFAAARLPALLRFAAVLTGERGLAEDVVQEVLLRVHQKWRKIGALDSPEHYVRRMIINGDHAQRPTAQLRPDSRGQRRPVRGHREFHARFEYRGGRSGPRPF